MAEFRVELIGGDQVLRRLERYRKKVTTQTVPVTLNAGALAILEASINLAPVLTGDLIRSARIARPKPAPGATSRIISYGVDYAEKQHEDTSLNPGPVTREKPATVDGPPGPKYLERPFRRLAPEIRKRLAAETKRDARVAGQGS